MCVFPGRVAAWSLATAAIFDHQGDAAIFVTHEVADGEAVAFPRRRRQIFLAFEGRGWGASGMPKPVSVCGSSRCLWRAMSPRISLVTMLIVNVHNLRVD